MARPPLEITPKMLSYTEKLASQGLTLEQIAASLGIHVGTLYKKKRQLNEFNEAIKSGKAKGIATITNVLFEKAKKGDNTAMIFYLKNRDQANWGERPIEQDTASEPLNITFQVAAPVSEVTTTIGKKKLAKD